MTSIFIPSRYENTAGVTSSIVNDYNLFTTDGATKPLADINWNNKKITNLNTPTNPNDAVNKAYVDSSAGNITISNDLNMLGKRITTLGQPILPEDAVKKSYVDLNFKSNNPLPVVNSYMSILLNASTVTYNDSTNNITNVGTPQSITLSLNSQTAVIKLLRDDNGMFLDFNKAGYLIVNGINSSDFTNTSCTLFSVVRAPFTSGVLTTLFNFMTLNNQINIYLPQADNRIYFEYGSGVNISRLARLLTAAERTSLSNTLFLLTCRKNGNTMDMFINGVSYATLNNGTGALTSANEVGNISFGLSSIVDIYEFHMFNRATDTTETNLINDYLMDKYRLRNLNMNGKVPTNIGTPVNTTDVVNKSYVDGSIFTVVSGLKNIISLPFTGSFKASNFFMKNYTCLYAMKVTRIAVYSDISVVLTITITKNNVIVTGGDVSKAVGTTSGTKTYTTPLTFAVGENLGIYCSAFTDTVTTYGVVN